MKHTFFAKSFVYLVACSIAVGCKSRNLQKTNSNELALKRNNAPPHPGIMEFMFGDFGGQSLDAEYALPTTYAVAAIVLQSQNTQPVLLSKSTSELWQIYKNEILKHGFLYPETIAGYENIVWDNRFPLGFRNSKNKKFPISVELLNTGCTACHAAPGFKRDGSRNPNEAWLGLPNPSVNFETYTAQLFSGLQEGLNTKETFFALFEKMFPNLTDWEKVQLKTVIFPIVKLKVGNLYKTYGRSTPHLNGDVGRTNGVGSLNYLMKLHQNNSSQAEIANYSRGYTSIPNLADKQFRSSLLADGSYGVPNLERFSKVTEAIAFNPQHVRNLARLGSFFTTPSQGVSLKEARSHENQFVEILNWVATDLKKPQYIGKINGDLATKGGVTFEKNCSQCHGYYRTNGFSSKIALYPNTIVPAKALGSSTERMELITDKLVEKLSKTKEYSEYVNLQNTGGYVAPILTGVWATAPYLHDGSVPNLKSLLWPELRTNLTFVAQGQYYDFENIGLPFLLPEEAKNNPGLKPIQLRKANANAHVKFTENLTEAEKTEIFEYFKVL